MRILTTTLALDESRAPAASEVLTDSELHALAPGKHTELTARASGQVRGITTVTARLAAFTLADIDRPSCRVLLKDRDGFFSADAIRRIMAALAQAPDAWANVEGFPEVEPGASCVILHCSRLELRAVDGDVLRFEPDLSAARSSAAPASGEATGDEPSRSKKRGVRMRAKTDTRHQHFVAWLCEVYGDGFLRSGCGVIDVAGGAGGLAFELSMRREIPCTVVDPRPVRCNAKQRRALRSQLQRAPALLATAPERGPAPPSRDDPNISAANDAAAAPPQPTELSLAAAQLGAHPRVLPLQVLSLFDDAFARSHRALLLESSMLVGMHPDQATEALIDLAVASRKPFALLPCCVFPTLFSARRLADGREVTSYEELCEYLVAKAVALYAKLPRLEHVAGDASSVLCGKCAERGEALPADPLDTRAGDTAADKGCDNVDVDVSGFVVSSTRLHSFEGRNLVIFSIPVGHDPRSLQSR
jgi:hypothetical protein